MFNYFSWRVELKKDWNIIDEIKGVNFMNIIEVHWTQVRTKQNFKLYPPGLVSSENVGADYRCKPEQKRKSWIAVGGVPARKYLTLKYSVPRSSIVEIFIP